MPNEDFTLVSGFDNGEAGFSQDAAVSSALLTPKIVKFLTKSSDPPGAGFIIGAEAPNWLAALPPKKTPVAM